MHRDIRRPRNAPATLGRRMSDTIKIKLKRPVVHGDEQITELVLHEPDIGGLIEMDNEPGDMGKVMQAIVACTGLPPSVVRQIKARDLPAIGEATAKLMGEESRLTGVRQVAGLPTILSGRQPN